MRWWDGFTRTRSRRDPRYQARVAYGLEYADWRLSAEPVGLVGTWRIQAGVRSSLQRRLSGHEDDATVRALVEEALDQHE